MTTRMMKCLVAIFLEPLMVVKIQKTLVMEIINLKRREGRKMILSVVISDADAPKDTFHIRLFIHILSRSIMVSRQLEPTQVNNLREEVVEDQGKQRLVNLGESTR